MFRCSLLLIGRGNTPSIGFQFVIGSKALKDALKGYEDRPKYQRLVIPFDKGEDPDDAYSSIAYEKGANFILHIGQISIITLLFKQLLRKPVERTVGGLDIFLPYVRDYVNAFMGKSITTDQWKEHLYTYFEKHHLEKVGALDGINWDVSRHAPTSTANYLGFSGVVVWRRY